MKDLSTGIVFRVEWNSTSENARINLLVGLDAVMEKYPAITKAEKIAILKLYVELLESNKADLNVK